MHYPSKPFFPILALITIVLWLLSKPSMAAITAAPANSIAQLLGLIGITALAWNFVVAARFKAVDKLYGGLDKVFKEHRFTGQLAFVLMLAHPLFLILSTGPNIEIAQMYAVPGSYWAFNWGMFALWGFTLLIALTLFGKLPYHIWKRTHQFMGVPMVFAALHVATIPSDVATYLPLRIWILGLAVTSLVLYIYKVFLYRFVGPRFAYQVDTVEIKNLVTEITLTPKGAPIDFRPGQFVFISIDDNAIGKEEHPFSISSAPGEDKLRLSIKASGDYTERLKGIQAGTNIKVYGPYGQFGEKYLTSKQKSVWIAGGIGVTPFLSLLRVADGTDVAFFYSTKNKEEAIYSDEIRAFLSAYPNVSFTEHLSDESGFLTANDISSKIQDLKERLIFICGPKPMMYKLAEDFTALGVPRKNIIFEDFSLR